MTLIAPTLDDMKRIASFDRSRPITAIFMAKIEHKNESYTIQCIERCWKVETLNTLFKMFDKNTLDRVHYYLMCAWDGRELLYYWDYPKPINGLWKKEPAVNRGYAK